MRGLILAAGRGIRLGPYTDERPKCLVTLAGQSLLERQRRALGQAGVEPIALVTGYQAGKLDGCGLPSFHAPRWRETNMVQSLTSARSWLRASPCVVSYGDIFYSAETVSRLIAGEGELAIAYDRSWLDLWSRRFADPLEDAESFRLGAGGVVEEIGRRPGSLEEIEGQFMGLLRFTPRSWDAAEEMIDTLGSEERDTLSTTALLDMLVASGHRVHAVERAGPWGELDRPSDLTVSEELLTNEPQAAAT